MIKHIDHSKDTILKRLNRVEGQVGGIKRMVSEGKDISDVLIQINSTRAALQKISQLLFEADIQHSLLSVSEGINVEEEFEKINSLVTQYSKVK